MASGQASGGSHPWGYLPITVEASELGLGCHFEAFVYRPSVCRSLG